MCCPSKRLGGRDSPFGREPVVPTHGGFLSKGALFGARLSRSRSRTERLAPQKDHPQSQRRGNEWLESEIPAEERDNVKNREPERREESPMPPPIVYVDTSAIREGKHQELEVAM